MAKSNNFAQFSNAFPVHGVTTSTALNELRNLCGYDVSYKNFYANGVPFKTPNYTGTITSISINITMTPYESINYGSQKYYIYISDTKYETTSSNAQYNNISSKSTATFNTTAGSSTWSQTISVSSLSLKPNTTYYVYIHYGTSKTGNLQRLTGLTITTGYYAISYNSNGTGTAPSAQYVFAGSSQTLANAIAAQTKNSYVINFNGNGGTCSTSSITSTIKTQNTKWALDSTSGTQYSPGASYKPTASVTMYAIWTDTQQPITLPAASTVTKSSTSTTATVTFNANGGSVSPTSASAKTTTSYSFNKWALNSANGTKYSAGDSYTPNSAVTFYATWNSNVNTESITLPTPTRANYSFLGWSTSASATTPDIGTGTIEPDSNMTIYALWSQNIITYNISYNYDGGTKGSQNPTSATVGSYFTVSNPTRSGYEFTGWTISGMDSGSDKIHYYGSSTNDGSNSTDTTNQLSGIFATKFKNLRYSNGTVTFKATWKEIEETPTVITYNIAYNYDGGSAGSSAPTIANTDEYITISNPTKANATFNGWKIDGMNGNPCYYGSYTTDSRNQYTTLTSLSGIKSTKFKNLRSSSGTVTFTATWSTSSSGGGTTPEPEITTYSISYVLNGGSKGTNAPTSAEVDTYIQISNPTKANATFDGWTISGLGSGTHYYANSKPIYGNNGATSVTGTSNLENIFATWFKNLDDEGGAVTFTANWLTTSTYTVSFSSGASGTSGSVNAITVRQGESITLPQNGFNRPSTNSNKTITFNPNGGYLSVPPTATYINEISYSFSGWKTGYSVFSRTYQPGNSYTPTSNTTFTAQWNSVNNDEPVLIPRATKPSEQTDIVAYTITLDHNNENNSNQQLYSYQYSSYSNDTWSTSSGATVNTGSYYTPTTNVTLTANWTSTSIDNTSVNLPVLNRTGYTFKGWSTTATATEAMIAAGSYKPTSDITLYAVWANDIHNMYINTQGGTMWDGNEYSTNLIETHFAYNTNTFIGARIKPDNTSFYEDNIPSKTGYTFTGFFANSGSAKLNTDGETFYFEGENANNATLISNSKQSWIFDGNSTEDVFIVANYNNNKYTVNYDVNNDKITGVSWIDTEHTYDIESNLAGATNTTEYEFLGWNTKSDGSGTMYSSGQAVKNLTSENNASVTLYAIWKIKGLVKIYSEGKWHNAQPYIYSNDNWKFTIIYTRQDNTWKLSQGS